MARSKRFTCKVCNYLGMFTEQRMAEKKDGEATIKTLIDVCPQCGNDIRPKDWF